MLFYIKWIKKGKSNFLITKTNKKINYKKNIGNAPMLQFWKITNKLYIKMLYYFI